MAICLERGADLHTAQLMPLPLTVSCFSKIQIGFTLLVPAHPGSPGKGPLNGCVCVCVCVLSRWVYVRNICTCCIRLSCAMCLVIIKAWAAFCRDVILQSQWQRLTMQTLQQKRSRKNLSQLHSVASLDNCSWSFLAPWGILSVSLCARNCDANYLIVLITFHLFVSLASVCPKCSIYLQDTVAIVFKM